MKTWHLSLIGYLLVMQASFTVGAGGSCWCPPFWWGSSCRSNTSIFGSRGHRVRYSISVGGNAGTLVCAEVYVPGRSGYQSIGCGHSSISGTVNWGNNLATPKIKCKGTPFGAVVSWRH